MNFYFDASLIRVLFRCLCKWLLFLSLLELSYTVTFLVLHQVFTAVQRYTMSDSVRYIHTQEQAQAEIDRLRLLERARNACKRRHNGTDPEVSRCTKQYGIYHDIDNIKTIVRTAPNHVESEYRWPFDGTTAKFISKDKQKLQVTLSTRFWTAVASILKISPIVFLS